MDPSLFSVSGSGPCAADSMMVAGARGLASWDQPWDIPLQWRFDHMQAMRRCGKPAAGVMTRCGRTISNLIDDRGPPAHGATSSRNVVTEAPLPTLNADGWALKPDRTDGAEEGKQYVGVVTKLRWQRGYAFVDCPEVKAMSGGEVYVPRRCLLEGMRVGDRVVVTLAIGAGRPSASSVFISI
mmetsp:Transcript_29267/g.83163  ORF Transcript_29267/g.83163 Transcript_29267/m.83163 type:complete len:183 (+) Transcript_29267:52-600(+)